MVQRSHVPGPPRAQGAERDPARKYGRIPYKASTQECTDSGRLQRIFRVVTEHAVQQLRLSSGILGF